MTGLEDLVAAAMSAPPERREAALRLLQGNLPKPEPFLTLIALGRQIGFSTRTLSRWQIPAHDLGASKRYRLSEVESYLKSDALLRRQAALRAERRDERALVRFQFDDGPIRPGRRQRSLNGRIPITKNHKPKDNSHGSPTTANQPH